MFVITTDVELTAGCVRHVLAHLPLYNEGGIKWRVRVTRDGNPVDLTGKTITCQILKGDGTAGAPISGSVEDGFAEVVLTEDCHDVPGETRLTMRAAADGEKTALAVLLYRLL